MPGVYDAAVVAAAAVRAYGRGRASLMAASALRPFSSLFFVSLLSSDELNY